MPHTRRTRDTFAAFLFCHRAEHPLPMELDALERQRGEVLADVFEDWLRANAARFEPKKKGLFGSAPPVPRFVYETDAACLAVLREREVLLPEGLTLVTVEELQAWRDDHPEAMEALYPIVSSFFTAGLPTAIFKRASARHPLRPGEELLLHCRSVWLTPSSGHGSDDLWKGDDTRLTLLEPRFSRWKT